ncbi:dihydroxyacetone kinase phosphoryl donor subunit DhaM [Umezawaea tangerina]|uniref:Phosphocarrier protein HPr n=1 Tax=Umezawaea tangerina TaxID=84725 RepID=A0A2T0SLR3_9PSEU|nr:dihydroxyacetone kinase phosphoryl donor subunit DhaM [Umezawaea tangerina]PRY34352.1 PTS hybrid protein [Umezawaea tangerina]
MTTRVGLVLVSHSRRLAEGVAELAAQMAPDVVVVAAGGDGDGGLGTDYATVTGAVVEADAGAGVVVLYDLGSARMVADMAAEDAEDRQVVVVDAPIVEGAVAAAVSAQGGAGLAVVAQAAVGAAPGAPNPAVRPSLRLVTNASRLDVVLTNEVGLHARPSALLARTVAELDADVVVRFGGEEADAKSVLALMGLGAPEGARIEVVASGKDADEALRRVEELAERGFDE